MGSCLSYCIGQKDTDLNDHLIRDVYCSRCKSHFLSTYEYNKHIVTCNQSYGDL